MNLERYIARRVSDGGKKNFTSIIVKIAIAAIALSLVVMIISTAMLRGFKHQISDKIFGFWGHIHIYDSNITRTFETVPIDISKPFYKNLVDLKNVDFQKPAGILGVEIDGAYTNQSTQGGISQVQSFTILPAILSTKNDFEGIMAKGVGKDFDWRQLSKYLIEGDTIAYDSVASKQAVVSKVLCQRLNVGVGDKFNVDFIIDGKQRKRQFLISGIYNTGLIEYDKKFILLDQRKIQDVLGWKEHQVGGIEIYVDNLDDINTLSEYIYYDVLPSQLYSETIKERFGNIFEWLELQNVNEVVILALMIVVSIINMITALLILILERTKMIGTLKSMGMKNWGIRKIFMYQAARIIGRGLIYGTVIGLVLCLLQQHFGFITLDEKNYYLSVAPIEINLWVVLLLNIGTLILTLIFLVLPTYIVTKISPIKALRFD